MEMNKTAERIRNIRKKTGMTQVAFASLFNIPRRTFEDWEMNSEKKKPQAYIINMLELCVNQLIESEYDNDIVNILQKK